MHNFNYITATATLHYTTTTVTTATTTTTALHHTASSSCGKVTTATIATTPKTQLQPPVDPSVDSLCHPWFTTTNLSYRSPFFETSATALCDTTGSCSCSCSCSCSLAMLETSTLGVCDSHAQLKSKFTPLWVSSPWYIGHKIFFPQQRMLMGSSAQNSSGVDWCRRRVRFNEVRRRFRRFRGALVQSGQVQQGSRVPEKVWEALVQSQVRFNRVPKKVPEKVPVKVWEGLVQSQVSFNRVSEKFPEKGPGGFGAEPGQVQQGSGEGSGEGLGGFGGKPRQVQRVPEKVAEKEVLGIFGAGPGQVPQVQQRVSSAWLRSTRFRKKFF